MYNWRRDFRCGKKRWNFLPSRNITYGEAIQDLLSSCKSFGPSKQGRRVLMKKNSGDNRAKKFCSEMWRNTVQGGSPIDTVECIWVNIGVCLIGFGHKTPEIHSFPVDTGHKLNGHRTFRRCPGRLLNFLCTINLRPVCMGCIQLINQCRVQKMKRCMQI